MEDMSKLEEYYLRLGEEYLVGYITQSPNMEAIKEICEAARPLYDELQEKEAAELAAKGLVLCPNPKCRHQLPIESKFCNMCGTSLVEDVLPNEKSEQGTVKISWNEAPTVPKILKCAGCGEEIIGDDPDAKFCPNCGRPRE